VGRLLRCKAYRLSRSGLTGSLAGEWSRLWLVNSKGAANSGSMGYAEILCLTFHRHWSKLYRLLVLLNINDTANFLSARSRKMWQKNFLKSRQLGQFVQKRNASSRRVIFSGIQPTGIPHIGNYAGAIRQWVKLQEDMDQTSTRFYSIVDLHAITTPKSAQLLRQWKRETLAALLASGIQPERSALFYQSSVSKGSSCFV
jgi:hypothetical protein